MNKILALLLLVSIISSTCSKKEEEEAKPCLVPCNTKSLPIDDGIVGTWRWVGCSGGTWGGEPTFPEPCESTELIITLDSITAIHNGIIEYVREYKIVLDSNGNGFPPELANPWLYIAPYDTLATYDSKIYKMHIEDNYLSLLKHGAIDLGPCYYGRCK